MRLDHVLAQEQHGRPLAEQLRATRLLYTVALFSLLLNAVEVPFLEHEELFLTICLFLIFAPSPDLVHVLALLFFVLFSLLLVVAAPV